MNKYELTSDMNENRPYWKMMVKTGPQRCGDALSSSAFTEARCGFQ